METKKYTGHFAALLTILIWGTTFISTKILLTDFQPVEILFFRFIIGYLVLRIANPHHNHRLSRKQEIVLLRKYVVNYRTAKRKEKAAKFIRISLANKAA